MAKRERTGPPSRASDENVRQNLVKTRIGGDLSFFMKDGEVGRRKASKQPDSFDVVIEFNVTIRRRPRAREPDLARSSWAASITGAIASPRSMGSGSGVAMPRVLELDFYG